jgi:hypothetical protein
VAAALIVVLALLQTSPAVAALARPGLLTPSGVAAGRTPVFSWTRVVGAASYQVQTASDASFTSDLVTRTTVNRRYVPNVGLKPGTVWWRVQARGGGSTSDWASASFTSTPAAAPTLLTPADAVTLDQPDEPALLTWTSVEGAASYTVQVDGVSTAGIRTTAYLVPNPASETPHTWRVKALFDGGSESPWSAARSFQVGLLAPVSLVTPPDGEPIDRGLLRWAPTAGAASYQLQVSTDQDFGSFVVNVSGLIVTTYNPQPLADGTYFWRVRAVDPSGGSRLWNVATVRTFGVSWNDRPALVSPDDGAAVGDPLSYEWTPVALADGYVVQLSQNDTFAAAQTEECTTRHASYVPVKAGDCWPTTAGTWFWRVVATHDTYAASTLPSDTRSFSYQPELVTQVAPVSGSTVSVPTLRWEPVSGAAQYKLSVVALDGGGGQVTDRTVNGTSYTPATTLTAGKSYRWSVQTFHSGGRRGPQPLPAGQPTFTMAALDPATSLLPNPTGPDDASTFHRFPMLTWERVIGATRYRIVTRPVGSPIATELAIDFTSPAGTNHMFNNLPQTLEWWVNAYAGSTLLGTGPSRTFTIEPVTSAGGFQVNGPATSTPTLEWAPVQEAGHYHVYVSDDPNLSPSSSLLPTTFVDTESTLFRMPESLADGTVYWQVVPCVNGSACAPLTPATESFTKTSAKAVPSIPDDGVSGPGPVTFSWAWYAGAASYALQVATDPGFTNLLDDVTTITNGFPADHFYPDGALYWRVAAIDGSGNQSPYSDPFAYNKITPAPTLDPAGGTGVFTWRPEPYAVAYDVEVDRDDVPVVSTTTDQPALALKNPLGPASYTWRVRSFDPDGNQGSWSAPLGFTVTAGAPALLSPMAGANLAPNDGFFTWSPVAAAESYRFERRRAGPGPLTQATTTAASAYAQVSFMSDAAWQWRVVALNSAGADLGASPWRAFTVDTVRPTVTAFRPAAGATVKRKVNFVMTFSEPVTAVSSTTVRLFRKGKSVAAKVTLSASKTQVVLNPTKKLARGARYTLKVSNGVRDLHGLAAIAKSWSVTVRK